MPALSMFFGIIIYMYQELDGRHNLPHIHAEYQDEEVVVTFEGEIMEGSMTNKKLKLVLAWVEIHKEELEANWKLLSDGREIFKIDPLR